MASAQQSSTDISLKQSILELGKLIKDPSCCPKQEELPGLDLLIEHWCEGGVEQEEFCQRLLRVFKRSTHNKIYHRILGELPESHREAVEAFVAGDKTAYQISKDLKTITAHDKKVTPEHIIEHPVAHDALANNRFSHHKNSTVSSKVVRHYLQPFENWGKNIGRETQGEKITPAITYYPKTVKQVQSIVKESVKNGRGIRVSGFRHSWAPVFGRKDHNQSNNGDVMISMLTELNAGVLPNLTALPTSLFQPDESQLNHIMKVNSAHVHGPVLANGKQYVRVGAATTNEQFRRWCIDEGRVTLPMNIIEVEITMGGANAPICHGAGIKNPTISDMVRAIEYVDVHGKVRKVGMSERSLLNAAAGCFGLLGVVTHITYECDPITTAVMRPTKIDVIRAIPPPPGMNYKDIPRELRPEKPLTQDEIAEDQQEFERRANDDYYAEWFWFPYSSKVWVNTWSTSTDVTTDVVSFPDEKTTTLQVLLTIIGNIGQNILKAIPLLTPFQQTIIMSWLAMENLPEKPIHALLPDALHFQRGVTNIRVRDLEVEFPLQPKLGTKTERDYTNVQKAWWDAIITCYAKKEKCPQRMPLEMRIMGGSQITMAPQRGHELGTCSIEILTLHAAADIWEPYAQEVLNKWTSLEDVHGRQLSVRPHWAKEWDNLKFRGKPWREVLKNESYPEQIAEFKKLLTILGQKQNWKLEDLKRTFSNDLFDYLFFDDIVGAPHPAVSLPAIISMEIKYRLELIDNQLMRLFKWLSKLLGRKSSRARNIARKNV